MTKEQIELNVQAELAWVKELAHVVAQVYLDLKAFPTISEFIQKNWGDPKYQGILRERHPTLVLNTWEHMENNIRTLPYHHRNSAWRIIFDYDWDADEDEVNFIEVLNALQEDPNLKKWAQSSPNDWIPVEGGVYSDPKYWESRIQACYKNYVRTGMWMNLINTTKEITSSTANEVEDEYIGFMEALARTHDKLPTLAISNALYQEVKDLLAKYHNAIVLAAYQDMGLDKTENKP